MLAIFPLLITTTALLAAYTSAAPLSHSPANPTDRVIPTLFRLTDPTAHRIPTAVAKDRAPNPGEKDIKPTTDRIPTAVAKDRAPNPGEKDIKPTTDRFPTLVAKDHALNLRKDIDPNTHRITSVVAKDRAQGPGEKYIVHSKPDVSPSSANIQYHAIVKREVLGPFLYAPLVPSSFDIAAEEWYKKNKHNGQVQLDNSLDTKTNEERKRTEAEAKG